VQTRLQLGAALLSIGLFASIYHPVGTAMIVSYADRLGREIGLNGVWGNLGVASSALVAGVIGQYLGWRFAFVIPGIVTVLVGVAFALTVVHEDRTGTRQAAAQVRVAKEDMWRVIVSLLIVVLAASTTACWRYRTPGAPQTARVVAACDSAFPFERQGSTR
jgi:MFS family permease